ncbi:MAG: hypothetical protein RR998_07165 [Oscillospiraceae bacterium]
MKNSEKLMKYIVFPSCCSIGICGIILLGIYLEYACRRYVNMTFNYLPLYGVKIMICSLWAVSARIIIALTRRSRCHGKLRIMAPAVVSACVLIAVGLIDWLFLSKQLMLNQTFDVFLLLFILCSIAREPSDTQAQPRAVENQESF